MKRFFLLTVPVVLCLAQLSASQDGSSWSSSSQQSDTGAAFNPKRTTETHTDKNGRSVDTTTVQARGPDGHYITYSQTERESVRVDASTVRNVERTFGTGPDGQRVLIQETREESRQLAGGENKVVRTISNPDANGALQVIRREMVDSKQVSPGVREANTTVYSADGNGGMSAAVQVHERDNTIADGSVQYSKSTQLSDGAGHWNLSEVREGTIKTAGQGSMREENVLRPDGEGKLAVIERKITRETNAAGESRDVTETYSTNVPGQAGNEGLQLVQRASTVRRTNSSGGQNTAEQVETANSGNPGDRLRLTQEAIDIVRPDGRGAAAQDRTVVNFGPDGQVNTMTVDIGKTTNPATIKVDTRTAVAPK